MHVPLALWVLGLCLEDEGEGFELSLYLLKPTPSEYHNYSGIVPRAPLCFGARNSSSRWAGIISEDRHLFQTGGGGGLLLLLVKIGI